LERKRREYSRVKVSWPVLIYTGEGLIEGEIKDISLDGAMIHCDKLPNLDHELDLSIAVPYSVFPVTASVRKVRLASYQGAVAVAHNFAVRFTGINEEDRRLLCYAIEAHGRESEVFSRLPGGFPETVGRGSLDDLTHLSRRLGRAPKDVLDEALRDLARKYKRP
jgi:hypothetical protein